MSNEENNNQDQQTNETFGEMVAGSIEPFELSDGKMMHTLLLPSILWNMASFVAILRNTYLSNNELPEIEIGGDVKEGRLPHPASPEELMHFDWIFGLQGTYLKVRFNLFINWLTDQQAPEPVEIDWKYFAQKWNKFSEIQDDR